MADTGISGLAGWTALILFFVVLGLVNFANLGWVFWIIGVLLLAVTSVAILRHGFN
jgi:hypothetical protein